MKVFLSGSAGFIGRHLHRALDERGWDVTTCDLRPADRGDALDLFRHNRTRYDLAIHCAATLAALYAAGVDNWDGYDDALSNLD